MKAPLVGRVVWGENMTTAAFFADGTWEVTGSTGKPLSGLAESFARRYEDACGGPSDGHYGHRILTELAAKVGGTLMLEDPEFADASLVH